MKNVIHSIELFLYYCIWTTAIVLSSYKFIEAQNEIFSNDSTLQASLVDLVDGWTFMGRKKDVSDFEWLCWKHFLRKTWIYLLFQFFVSEALRKLEIKMLKYWYITSSLIYIVLNLGAKHLLLVLSQPVIYFMILVCGGKRVSIWITSAILLLFFDIIKNKYAVWDFLDDNLQDADIFLILVALGWTELRCISYSIDYIENQEKEKSGDKYHINAGIFQNTINILSYVLYMPLLYTGPIMLYEEFENSFLIKLESLRARLKRFFTDMAIFGIYSLLLEISFYYIYFYALQNDVKLIKNLSSVALAGAGLWMGFQFYIKYVIEYGTTAAFARLDNLEAPPTPQCIARIHVYSLMWRYFDVGLYKFLVKYIYKPTYGTLNKHINMSKMLYKIIASFCTFSFIFMWHGLTLNIFIWSTMNYFGILLEYAAKAMSTTDWYIKFKANVLQTEAMECRLIAALSAPLLAVSAISNFYLFGGSEVGHVYVAVLYESPALHNIMLAMISTYSCAHVSMALLDVTVRTDIKRLRIKAD